MFTGDRGLNALLESGVLQQQVPLANFTTWRVGGPAQWLAEPNDAEQCLELLQQRLDRRWKCVCAWPNV